MAAPLAGLRVVEVTNWMAAPSAGAMLADMGADVVKIEPLSGDVVRGMMRPPKVAEGKAKIDYSFTVDNRGKRSVAVAIDQPHGADVVRRLVGDTDVFLCNLLPHRQQRYGLDADTLLGLNPRLIHATLSGYGLQGPDAQRPGFDVTTFFGRGAITDSITDPGGVAPNPRVAQGDHTAALALVASILAALRLVDQTGEGQVVDVSLLATAAWTMATDLSAVLIDGRQPHKRDRHHAISALANRFLCRDDRWIILNMPEPRWWPRFCETVGHPEWLEDRRFTSQKDRFQHMPELTDLIDEMFVTRTLAEWGQIFDQAGLIWGPATTLAELAQDPQAHASGLFPEVDHPAGRFPTVAAPIHIRGADIRPRGPAPDIGSDTAEVLEQSGLSRSEVAALAAAGVVGPAWLTDEDGDG
jgi:crotonobetainyl-CoA:carnitine CoA-transferase CaiB-like acyl-CoA transferase